MARRKVSPGRLGAFSDGVIAIIITIMVLELKMPSHPTRAALFTEWPTFASYALSYLFVAIVWVNHHHLLGMAESACPSIIWSNMALLFFVSLIPFFTAYMAENRMDSFTMALYATVFLLITIAFQLFQSSIVRHLDSSEEQRRMNSAATRRNCIAMILYALAILAAYFHPWISLALILTVSLLYFIPDVRNATVRHEGHRGLDRG